MVIEIMTAANAITAVAQTPTTIALIGNGIKAARGTVAMRTNKTGTDGKVDGAANSAAEVMIVVVPVVAVTTVVSNTAAAGMADAHPAAAGHQHARTLGASFEQQLLGASGHGDVEAKLLVELKVDVVASGEVTPHVLTEALTAVLERSGVSAEEIDLCVIPEGNAGYMVVELEEAGLLTPEWVALKDKIYENLTWVGATGSAAVPIALDDAWKNGRMKTGDKVMVLTGTVTEWKWTNPHVWIILSVDEGNGGKVQWAIEGRTPGQLVRAGWSKTILKPGDTITVDFSPAKDGSRTGLLTRVRRPDGSVVGQAPPAQ